MVDASADPAIRRYNGSHDRDGRPAAPPTLTEAQAAIDQFTQSWWAFTTTGKPSGVAFVIEDAEAGTPVGCCGVDDWTEEDVAQIGYWIAAPSRATGTPLVRLFCSHAGCSTSVRLAFPHDRRWQ